MIAFSFSVNEYTNVCQKIFFLAFITLQQQKINQDGVFSHLCECAVDFTEQFNQGMKEDVGFAAEKQRRRTTKALN